MDKSKIKILVVDGNSPDGTGRIALEKAKSYPDIYLYEETSKDGLGAAYLKGFNYAMEKLEADAVFEFDADFQHPPEMIGLMLQEIENGFDYVIGSRKISSDSSMNSGSTMRPAESTRKHVTTRPCFASRIASIG